MNIIDELRMFSPSNVLSYKVVKFNYKNMSLHAMFETEGRWLFDLYGLASRGEWESVFKPTLAIFSLYHFC